MVQSELTELLTELTAITPIDGRYREKVKELAGYFSEAALMKYRVKIEAAYLSALSEQGLFRTLTNEEEGLLQGLSKNFTLDDAGRIKDFEAKTNHDVKAVEYFIREKLGKSSLEDVLGFIHFGLTSYDINDNALSMMLRDAVENVYIPSLAKLDEKLLDLAEEYKDLPMLSRTHGQPASPTTLGKEFSVFGYRLTEQMEKLATSSYPGKLNGAVGNFNAPQLAYPDIDWIGFSGQFVLSLGLAPNMITTQIEPHDSLVEILQNIVRINNIILDLDQDMWRYISDSYLIQKPKEGEVGSSTMPHKVNPIDFENSEGNIAMANGLLNAIAGKLQVSRLQRDLSDSTVTRNVGPSLAFSLLASKNALRGLGKIYADRDYLAFELSQHPEILTEAIQTVLRKEGIPEAHEKLMALSRGRKISLLDLENFVSGLDISAEAKRELIGLEPQKYTGLAEKLTDKAVFESREILRGLK